VKMAQNVIDQESDKVFEKIRDYGFGWQNIPLLKITIRILKK
jgi:hypothetical protein